MPWFFITFFLFLAFNNNISEAIHSKKLPSAAVVGTVYCDTCFQDDFLKNSHFISGATVAVECKDENSRFHQEVKTNENGKFKVNLPISISKHVRKIKKCSVKLVRSNEPYCSIASSATSSSLTLKSRKQGIHIFSAGFFSFKPEKQPNHCNKKPSFKTSNEFNSISDLSPIQDPTIPDLPPPLPPLPKLPPLPPLPQLPILPPFPEKEEKNSKNLKKPQDLSDPDFFFPTPPFFPPVLPPNPLQPPPLIPNPFQPPPLIPNPFQPPPAPILPPIPGYTPPTPAPIIPFPPIPGFTPSPPPPPTFPPFPFPPLFPPTPPGVPPAGSRSSSTLKKPSP